MYSEERVSNFFYGLMLEEGQMFKYIIDESLL